MVLKTLVKITLVLLTWKPMSAQNSCQKTHKTAPIKEEMSANLSKISIKHDLY